MSAKSLQRAEPGSGAKLPRPRAAYVHVPFCRHRCGYCNFTLIAGRDDLIGDYLRAIEREVCRTERAGPTVDEVDTLYFGGGTPTHIGPSQLSHLASIVLRRHSLAHGYEWTVEANPADVDEAMIGTLSDLGVNRLSLGGQSFNSAKLRLLERDHEADSIRRAVQLAREAGIQLAIDLIFAASGETLADWDADLSAALEVGPDHISTYGLTFEAGTSFWNRRIRGELKEVDEELQREMFALAIDRLSNAGFEHYEVSNFSRPGCRSRHNETYWSGRGYFAYGPGAARYIDGVRETNHRSTTTYIHRMLLGQSPVAEREELSPEGRARELLVFGLRRLEGVSRRQFTEITGCSVDELVREPLRKFVELGFLADDGKRIRLTWEGLFVSDALWPEML